jgi:hypothetical protein
MVVVRRAPLRVTVLLASLASLLLASLAFADGRFDGKWSFSGMSEGYTVQQWFKSCGPPPVAGGASGGGTVNVVTVGDELSFGNYTTNRCWDPMPTLVREAHSRDAAGGSWRTHCVTPAGDPRRATVNTSVQAISDDKIILQENGRYEITVTEGTCVADVHRSGVLNRIKSADSTLDGGPSPAAASASSQPSLTAPVATQPPAPAPAVDCSNPGDPARLEVRPSRKLMRPGESFTFRAVVSDASGCPTVTQTTWALGGATQGIAQVDNTGKVTVPDSAQEGSFDVVVTAAGKSTRVTVDVTTPAKYDELLAKSGFNSSGEDDSASVAVIATSSLGGDKAKAEDNSSKRKTLFIAVVGGVAALLGIIAIFGLGRSRRAAQLEKEARERHAARVEEYEARRREKEAKYNAQLQAHIDSVKRAQDAAAAAPTPPAGEMVCPSCRREYPPGSTFCPSDANRLIPLAGHEDVLTGPAGGICPTCKRGFNPGVKVCPYDKEELVPFAMAAGGPGGAAPGSVAAPPSRGKICPTCGGRFEGTAAFCGKDGTALVLLN